MTNSAAAADNDDDESFDLDFCSNAVQNQMDNGKENEMLLKELETENNLMLMMMKKSPIYVLSTELIEFTNLEQIDSIQNEKVKFGKSLPTSFSCFFLQFIT